MSEASDCTRSKVRRRRRLQFSLWGLLVATTGIAVGLSVIRAEGTRWDYVPFVAASTWIVMGLLAQAYDQWTWQRSAAMGAEERLGWWFSSLWRVALAGVLVLYYMILQLPEHGTKFLLEADDFVLFASGNDMRDAVAWLALIVVLNSVGLPRSARRSNWFTKVVGFLGIVAGAGIVAWVARDRLCIPVLVYIAIFGIDSAEPLQYATGAAQQGYSSHMRVFFHAAWLALGSATLGAVLLAAMFRQWPRRAWRWLLAVGFVLSVIPAAGFAVWTYGKQLRWLSPSFAEGLGWAKPHQWIAAILMAAIPITVAAWRGGHEPALHPEATWRRHCKSYYHERVPVVLFVSVALVGFFLWDIVDASQTSYGVALGGGSSILWLLGSLATAPPGALYLAAAISAVVALVRSWRTTDRSAWNTPGPLAPGRFWTAWVALWILLAVALPAITWTAFSSYFETWLLTP